MATEGRILGTAKIGGSLTSNYEFWAEWKRNSYSIENNTSNITVTLMLKCTAWANGAYDFVLKPNVSIMVNGESVNPEIDYIDTRNYVVCAFATWTGDVLHNDDGSLSCPITASFSKSGWTTLDSGSASGTAELETIPRASTIVSAADVTLGNACGIKWVPKSTLFGYKLVFSCGDWSHTTDIIHPDRVSEYTYSGYSIPLEVAEQVTNDRTGIITATLYTYSDITASNQIGDADTKDFVFTIPENEHTRPDTYIDAIMPITSMAEVFSDAFVQGRSKAEVRHYAFARYGASIVKYAISVDGKTVETESGDYFVSDFLSKSGVVTVKVTSTDSRGFSSTTSEDINVESYSPPKVVPVPGEDEVVCARCNADGELSDTGTFIAVKARRVYSSVGTRNTCGLWYRWKLASAPDSGYSDPVYLLRNGGTEDNFDGVVSNVVFHKDNNYMVQIGATDDAGESVSVTFTIFSEKVYWHRGDGFLALGMHTNNGGLEVAWPTTFYGDIYVGGVSLEDYIKSVINGGG